MLSALRRVTIRSSIACFQPINTKVLSLVHGVGSVLSFSAQPHSTMEISKFLIIVHPLAVLSHLRPRFAYILDHSGHARSRSRRRALARREKMIGSSIDFVLCFHPYRGGGQRTVVRCPVPSTVKVKRFLHISTHRNTNLAHGYDISIRKSRQVATSVLGCDGTISSRCTLRCSKYVPCFL